MKTLHQVFQLTISLSIIIFMSACDGTLTEENNDSFANLDDIGQTGASNELVVIENQFGDKIALELWSGENIEYNQNDGKVYATNLKKHSAEPILLESFATTSLDITESKDFLAVIGVRISGTTENNDEIYEYLTEEKLFNVVNGSGIRLNNRGAITAFSSSACLTDLTSTQVSNNTDITNTIITIADAVATQWQPLKEITSPMDSLIKFAKASINENSVQQLQLLNALNQWTYDQGTYTHTDTVSNAQLNISTQFVWNGLAGHGTDEVISENLHDPSNYFSNLSVSRSADRLTFSYDNAGVLAPLLGLDQDASASSQEISILNWVKKLVAVYKTLKWNITLNVIYDNAGDKLDTVLEYTGRPSYNIDLKIQSQSLKVSQNPFTFSLVDNPSNFEGSRSAESQTIDLEAWSLKVFPGTIGVSDDGGSKGVINFSVDSDNSFNYTGSMAYNSDTQTPTKVVLTCPLDNSPIVF